MIKFQELQEIWIGLDAGSVRCGIALSDSSATLASPREVILTEPRVTLARRVAELLPDVLPLGLVVGLPLTLRGEEGPASALARELGQLLAAELGCPLHFVDERFTTVEADARRHSAGRKSGSRKREIDAWAAASILQGFLDNLQRI